MMKALIRNPGETVTEDMNISGIDWTTGAPLTNEAWYGGRYTLVQNYVAPTEEADESYEIVEPEQTETVAETEEETITIDGQEYSLEEVRRLLAHME